MTSCGMYDFSGEWTYYCGLPGKSGVSGCIYAVVPGKMGISVWSPPLDSRGNSVKGIQFMKELVEKLKLHHFGGFDHKVWKNANKGEHGDKHSNINVRSTETYKKNKKYKPSKTVRAVPSSLFGRQLTTFERFKQKSTKNLKNLAKRDSLKRRSKNKNMINNNNNHNNTNTGMLTPELTPNNSNERSNFTYGNGTNSFNHTAPHHDEKETLRSAHSEELSHREILEHTFEDDEPQTQHRKIHFGLTP